MRIIFAGTPTFSVAPFTALLAMHDIVAVFTQPDRKSGRGKKLTAPPVKEVALAHNIPVFQPTSLKNQTDLIRGLNPDVMVVVAYGMLLPQSILDIPRLGCLNIHASILPRWRGAAPIQRAIEAGDANTGISIMQMELGLDTGPVYQILTTPITQQDDSASMHDKLATLGAQGIVETLKKLTDNPDYPSTPQDNTVANYAKKLHKSESDIDWQQSAQQIDCKIRALTPWPICQTFYKTQENKQQRIRIWRARAVNIDSHVTDKPLPGRIIDINQDGILVACGTGQLQINLLQKDGGKPLNSTQFLNGFPIKVGDLFTQNTLENE